METWAEHVEHTYTAIKEADPDAVVIMALANTITFAFCDGYVDRDSIVAPGFKVEIFQENCDDTKIVDQRTEVVHALTNAREFFDAVDLHLYGHHELIPDQMSWVRDILDAPEKQIWALEGGGPFTAVDEIYSEQKEASYLVRAFTLAFHARIGGMIWGMYTLESGDFGNEFTNLGLLGVDLRRKPAFYAYRQLSDMVAGFTSIEKLDLHEDLEAYRYTVNGGTVDLIWGPEGTVVDLPVQGERMRVTETIDVESDAALFWDFPVTDGNLRFRMRAVPVYVTASPEP